jgi:hypothetical protein
MAQRGVSAERDPFRLLDDSTVKGLVAIVDQRRRSGYLPSSTRTLPSWSIVPEVPEAKLRIVRSMRLANGAAAFAISGAATNRADVFVVEDEQKTRREAMFRDIPQELPILIGTSACSSPPKCESIFVLRKPRYRVINGVSVSLYATTAVSDHMLDSIRIAGARI